MLSHFISDTELGSVETFAEPGVSEPVSSIRHYTESVYDWRTRSNQMQTFNHFKSPQYIAVNEDSILAVSDRAANAITLFEDGKRFASYGSKGKVENTAGLN